LLSKKETIGTFAAFVAICGAFAAVYVFARRQAEPVLEAGHSLVSDPNWEVVRIVPEERSKPAFGPDQVFFKNGSTTDHIGFELNYLGQLTSPDGSPVVVLSGRTCVGCDAGMSFFMYSPKSNQVGTYAYPAGNVSSKDDGSDDKPELYYSGRAFLGKCLLSHAEWEGIIAFGRQRDELGAWESVVQVYEFEPDGAFNGKAIYQNLPDIAESLKRVAQGVCREMPAKDYTD